MHWHVVVSLSAPPSESSSSVLFLLLALRDAGWVAFPLVFLPAAPLFLALVFSCLSADGFPFEVVLALPRAVLLLFFVIFTGRSFEVWPALAFFFAAALTAVPVFEVPSGLLVGDCSEAIGSAVATCSVAL